MTTLESLKLNVQIVSGPSREDLFDALRLADLRPDVQFLFYVTDQEEQLQYLNAWGEPEFSPRTSVELPAQILGIERMPGFESFSGTRIYGVFWRIHARLLVKLLEHHEKSTKVFSRRIETWFDYGTQLRKGQLHDCRFIQKCMRYNPQWDENNLGGLWFDREIARLK